jgi:hypothetical protein
MRSVNETRHFVYGARLHFTLLRESIKARVLRRKMELGDDQTTIKSSAGI